MKQNERFLVYAVTGFLALILLVAVVFGREPSHDGAVNSAGSPAGSTGSTGSTGIVPEADASGTKSAKVGQGLGDILGRPSGDHTGASSASAPNKSAVGLPAPNQRKPEQPLVAAERPLLAGDLVSQQLGSNRRDRTVRLVRAKTGDSLEMLVRRWCGARDPFLAEAKSLNEDLVVLRVGQEVAVPWVDDEVLLAALEAQKPKTLLAAEGAVPESGPGVAKDAVADRSRPLPTTADSTSLFERPSFVEPGALGKDGDTERKLATSAGTSYTVKKGDTLWGIAERTYGRKNADRMVAEIKQANQGLGESLQIGKKLVLPQVPGGA